MLPFPFAPSLLVRTLFFAGWLGSRLVCPEPVGARDLVSGGTTSEAQWWDERQRRRTDDISLLPRPFAEPFAVFEIIILAEWLPRV